MSSTRWMDLATSAACAAVALVFVGCDTKPPPDLLRMPERELALPRPVDDAGRPPWNRTFCRELPEEELSASFGDLSFYGECRFHQSAPAKCNARGDDFFVAVTRQLEEGRSFWLYMNVEGFNGSGEYAEKGQVHIVVKDGPTLYRWSNWGSSVNLGLVQGGGANGRFVVPRTAQANVSAVVFTPMTLAPQPGTPASGNIAISGTIGCVAANQNDDLRPWTR